jgi:hypothetical protein
MHNYKTHKITVVSGRENLATDLERWFIEGKSPKLDVKKSDVWKSDSPIVVKSEPWSSEFQDTLRAERLGARVHRAVAVLDGDITYHTAFENLAGISCSSVVYSQIPSPLRLLLVAKMLETLASVHNGENDWVLVHGDAHPRNFVIKGVLDFQLFDERTEVYLVDLRNSQQFYPSLYGLNGHFSPLHDLVELILEVKRTSDLCASELLALVATHYLPRVSPLLRPLNLLDRLKDKLENPPKTERREVSSWEYD